MTIQPLTWEKRPQKVDLGGGPEHFLVIENQSLLNIARGHGGCCGAILLRKLQFP